MNDQDIQRAKQNANRCAKSGNHFTRKSAEQELARVLNESLSLAQRFDAVECLRTLCQSLPYN